MKVTLKLLAFIMFSISLSTSTLGQINTTTKLNSLLIGQWVVTVEDSDKDRGLKILGVTKKSEENFSLDAKFGWYGEEQPVTSAEISQNNKEIKLTIATKSGAKVVATQISEDSFVGTFSFREEKVRDIALNKLSENMPKKTSPTITPPTSDVPKICADFIGGWTGTWTNSGTVYLWVVNVDNKCTVKYAYSKSPNPRIFKMGEVKNGVLEVPVSVGVNYFRFQDGRIFDRFIGSGIDDELAFQKVGLSPEDQARAITEQKELEKKDFTPLQASVPASCAIFHGSWAGKWSQGNIPDQRLQVVEITPTCTARYSYTNISNPGRTFETTEIRNGEMTFICNKETSGTCTFTVKGDDLWANYSNPSGGSNSGVFKKQQ